MKKIEEFVSGHTELGTGYRYFVPTFINDEWIWSDSAISKLLGKAAVKLGELNSFSRLVPNIDLFIQLHVTKEAVTSSRIEGTQTLSDILQLKTGVEDFIRSNYGRRSTNAIKIIHRLMINPYINIEQAMEICHTSYNPSNDLLKQLQQDGYITETSGQSRNRIFIFKKYLDLFDKTDK